ncbi:MAG TPA: C4-type zinc ribbon domain-containing protein [Blastocatellia bacterium]|nr:C4-type zinc ribbon domain-containing protein [Blastocatellia bacterium]
MNSELSHLISLQDADVEIKRLKEEIESLPARRAELERQFAESVKEYLAIKQELEDSQASRRRLEGELEHEQQKHQKFKNDLMKATNEREYTTAVREIDVTRKAISALETEVLKLMERIEKLDAQVAERTPEMESRRVEIDRQLKEWLATADANQQRLETLRAERGPMIQSLSPDARATYERLSRMRSGFALAEARDYSCMACRMKIRPQVFADIRKGDSIITCESCGRILYFKVEAAVT